MPKVFHNIDDVPDWLVPFVEKTISKNWSKRSGRYVEFYYFRKKTIPLDEMLKHDNELNEHLKWKISGTCTQCGNEFTTVWKEICHRNKHRKEHFCGKCLRKEQFTVEWRHHNSEAQKKVQGTKEARERMSKILKEKHQKDPTLREKISNSLKKLYKNNPEQREKVSRALKKLWNDPEYQTKVTGCAFYHGFYQSKFGEIFFASSWELLFLDWMENNDEISFFKRCDDKIEYMTIEGSHSRYFPDFEAQVNGKKFVFEVKGKINMIEVENKRIAALRFYEGQKTYVIMFKNDLQRIGIKFGKAAFHQKLVSLIPKIRNGQIGKKSMSDYFKEKGYL